MTELIDIKSLFPSELEKQLTAAGYPKFRASQVSGWLNKGVADFSQMKNIPGDLRDYLNTTYYISVATIEKKLISRYDKTVKYLFSFRDGETVEAVVMHYHHGVSMCISTQVGCKMGCTFCATGKSGFSRDLTASEMLAQIEAAQNDLDLRIGGVVLMGMGEPLDNFDNVVRFIELLTSGGGVQIGARHITLSTCGLVPKIYELAQRGYPINLAVSLHAPNDGIRRRTMPVAKAYPMDKLLKACRDYFDSTGRRVTFEYALISGVNDSDSHARELAQKLSGMNCHVNLIPVNSVDGTGYKKSDRQRQQSFTNILTEKGIAATVRRTLGSDINASCGQLKRNQSKEGGQ